MGDDVSSDPKVKTNLQMKAEVICREEEKNLKAQLPLIFHGDGADQDE